MKFILLIIALHTFFTTKKETVKTWHLTGQAQGTVYRITYYAADSIFTLREADSVFNRLDSSLSLYKPYSLVSLFNNANDGIVADDHLQLVVKRALEVYTDTQGDFDITVWPLVNLWGFGLEKNTNLPDSNTVLAIMPCIGSVKLQLQQKRLVKKMPCVQIDVNGIAQGYSVDVISAFIESKGISNYLVEIGGEIRMKGRKHPGNVKMKIGIEAPVDDLSGTSLLNKVIELDSGAVTTSGSYRRFYESNGQRITHLIDPHTGFTVANELISVTVLAKDAITADAYDNALMVMGLERALRFAEKRNDIDAYFIYRDKKGRIHDTATTGFYTVMQN
ncbi:MAG: FAD:protein FMN transferase [Chitinophagaceae bacterium]